MKTKTQQPRQYIATGIIGVFAIIAGMIVIQRKQAHNMPFTSQQDTRHALEHSVAPPFSKRNNTLQDLCEQEQCQWNITQDECECTDTTRN